MARTDKITPANIEQKLNEKAAEHRGFGYNTFRKLYSAKLNTTGMALAFNVRYETMKKYKAVEKQKRELLKVQQDTEIEMLKKV